MPLKPRTIVIWNANAGSVEKASQIREKLDSRPDTAVYESSSAEEAQQIVADACNAGIETIVAAGGDGTINTVVNAIPREGCSVRFAVLPVGTANDWCWSLGIPDDLEQALQLLDSGNVRQIDLGEMETSDGTHCFANVATGGNSQRVTEVLTDEIKQQWGAFCYLRGAVEIVADLQSFEAEVRFDEGPAEKLSIWNIIIGNGRTSAGRLSVAPHANLEDGLLDVIIIRDGDLIDLAQLAAGFALGDYTEMEQVCFRRAKSVAISARPELHFSLDGQLIEVPPRSFRIRPQALPVIVGPEYGQR